MCGGIELCNEFWILKPITALSEHLRLRNAGAGREPCAVTARGTCMCSYIK